MKRIFLAALTVVVAACGGMKQDQLAIDSETGASSAQQGMSWEDFRANAVKIESGTGFYIVDGDIVLTSDKLLKEFYDNNVKKGQLIINKIASGDDRWSDAQKLNLTYCIGNGFGANKQAVIDAMASATTAWANAANIKYIYVPAQDANCTASNNNVVFDVNQISGQQYLARAFFPAQSRSTRNVIIDTSSFGQGNLVGILRHELGHTLGFRHEHTRPEAGRCFEDNNWRSLTTYDSASVMHYPQCNGTGNFNSLALTARDISGAASVYGAPGGGGTGGGAGGGAPTGGGAGGGGGTGGGAGGGAPTGGVTVENFSGSLAAGATNFLTPFSVKAGSTFTAVLSGTGDADLYVRFGSQPTATRFNCRPYLDGSAETCSLSVPAGQSQAFVAVDGYTAATYALKVTYTKP